MSDEEQRQQQLDSVTSPLIEAANALRIWLALNQPPDAQVRRHGESPLGSPTEGDEDAVMLGECCREMQQQTEYRTITQCGEHGMACPDLVIVPLADGLAIPIRDGGESGYIIRFCPWCGLNLAPSIDNEGR